MSNTRIGIITDSTCNIPDDLIKKHNILVQPQYVIWGTEELRDQVDIDSPTFYARLQSDPVHPTTSQPTPKDFLNQIEKAKAAGAEEVVILCVSNQLSGTVLSANQAKEMADIPVHVHDSLSAAMGLGWQALAAASARDEGKSAEEIVAAATAVRDTMAITLTVDTLEYLHKGGRIGGAQRLLGTALNLKPQLYVDHSIGKIMPGERTRTRKRAVEHVFKAFFEQMDTSKDMFVTVMHVDVKDDADALAARVKTEFKPTELMVIELSPVIGVHVGPGTLGLAGYCA